MNVNMLVACMKVLDKWLDRSKNNVISDRELMQ